LPSYGLCLSRLLDYLKKIAKCEKMADNKCEGCPVKNECMVVEGLFDVIYGELGDFSVDDYCRMIGIEIED